MRVLLLLCSIFSLGNALAGELYRSIDSSGKVHYSDKPIPGSESIERLKLPAEPAADKSLPYETLRAKQNFPVILYVSPGCKTACQQARELLNLRDTPFSEVSLITQQDIDLYRKNSGFSEVPGLAVGRTWIRGFLAEQWHKELDFAGYPKPAPHRLHATPPASKPMP